MKCEAVCDAWLFAGARRILPTDPVPRHHGLPMAQTPIRARMPGVLPEVYFPSQFGSMGLSATRNSAGERGMSITSIPPMRPVSVCTPSSLTGNLTNRSERRTRKMTRRRRGTHVPRSPSWSDPANRRYAPFADRVQSPVPSPGPPSRLRNWHGLGKGGFNVCTSKAR
jgi:hypothetical protein